MKELPKISIVTPSFNQGRYIEQTIQSVLDQKYPNLEYIIIDGGSTDETIDIIRKYEKHISFSVSEKDKGQTDAINKGFAKCTGDIFNWINSDDYYEEGALLKIGRLFKENEQAHIICGKEWSFNDLNPEERVLNAGSIIKENVFESIRTGIIDQPCTFFRKKIIDEFFPLNISLHYTMDRQLWWAYLLKHGQENIVQTKEVLTNFRIHPASKTVSNGDRVDEEFDRLKLSLFESLDAPEILKQQPEKKLLPLDCRWQVNIQPTLVLAAFASFYAERNYVKDELDVTAKLMSLVKNWKGRNMNSRERTLWRNSTVVPRPLLMGLKKIKNSISIF